MRTVLSVAALAAAASFATAGEVIDFNLASGQTATVQSGGGALEFGVEGSFEVDGLRGSDGRLIDASLVGLDLTVVSTSVFDLGPLGLVSLSNIGITLARPGGQEFFFQEATGDAPIGDFAGFLDTEAIADLTGTLEVDTDRNGEADISTDLSTIDVAFRTFDFEAMIIRQRNSEVYELTTFFELNIETGLNGQPVPLTINFDTTAEGRIPAPAGISLAGLIGLLTFRRRR